MILAFRLSMPNIGSWNGRWTGEGNLYCRTRVYRGKKSQERARLILDGGSYYYNFGDGWGASVSVVEVDAAEARKLRAASRGFCGYEWMIDEIEQHGRILPLSARVSR